MANRIGLDHAVDIGLGTLQAIRRKKPPLATYAYPNYKLFNTFFKGNVKEVGDKLEGHVTLASEDNAGHGGFWDEDTLSKKNIQSKYEVPWKRAYGGMLWNEIESSINQSPARIYNVWEAQYDSAVKDIVEEVQKKVLGAPLSSSDDTSPYSIFSWLSCGTAATEGFSGYSAHYDDAVDVGNSSKTTFNKGGLASSATSKADWASYYGDHQGNIDDSLLQMLHAAVLKLNFQPPVVPEKLPMEKVTYSIYTSLNVIQKLDAFYRASDDNMGYRPDGYFGEPTFKRIPMMYCPPLDIAKTDVYGTDPIVGLNHNNIYPVILKGWDFSISRQRDRNRHVVMSLFMDLVYQVWANSSPKYCGFLLSQHPDSD